MNPTEIFAHFTDLLHFVFIFFPILIYFIPFNNFIVKISFLFSALTPLGWLLFDNECIITEFVRFIIDPHNKNTKYQKSFSERYLGWFYFPILDLFNFQNNNQNIYFLVKLHWVINNILLWYYVFFHNCSC